MSEPRIRRAAVLAAGHGTRMGEITASIPKPMLPVQGRPLLEHVMEGLEAAGVEEFLLVVGYHRETIETHFRAWRHSVRFVVQQQVNGTGSAALLAREFAAGEPFILTFGDILCERSAYARCAQTLAAHPGTAGVLGVTEIDDPYRSAAVYANEQGRISQVIEKPPRGSSTTHWGSAGLYAFDAGVFDYLARLTPSPRNEYELTSIFDMILADGRDLYISPVGGAWRDIGRPEDLAAANATDAGSPRSE